jgi:hypothetical protein
MSNITYLADKLDNALLDTPLHALELVKERIETGQQSPTKLIVISLDDSDGLYDVKWQQAGMTMSQLLALLEIVKSIAINEMGY